MKLEIHSRDVALTGDLKWHIERRFRRALSRVQDRVRRVRISLTDLNGPKGGEDILCTAHADIVGSGELVISEVHHDPFASAARVSGRISDAVKKRLGRLVLRGRRHRSGLRSRARRSAG